MKMRIMPSGKSRQKDKLDTVPTNKELNDESAAMKEMRNMLSSSLQPIQFFDMKDKHVSYNINSIMSLPLELHGVDNMDVSRHAELLNDLSLADFTFLDKNNRMIQAKNIYGALLECIIANFQIFAYNAPSLEIFNVPDKQNVRNDIFTKFGIYCYNNINGCMDDLREYLDNVYRLDIYSINDIDNNMNADDARINRTIAIMKAISMQVNNKIAYLICDFVSYYIIRDITAMSDKDIEFIVNNIKRVFDINENLKLSNRVELRSFIGEFARKDIATILVNNIIPAANHICDNSFLTTFYVYKDIAVEKF